MLNLTNISPIHSFFSVAQDNVASIEASATVIEGVSRSRNVLLNSDTKNYDWDSGYTCHQLGSGAIVVQLAQPYLINSVRYVQVFYVLRNFICFMKKFKCTQVMACIIHDLHTPKNTWNSSNQSDYHGQLIL